MFLSAISFIDAIAHTIALDSPIWYNMQRPVGKGFYECEHALKVGGEDSQKCFLGRRRTPKSVLSGSRLQSLLGDHNNPPEGINSIAQVRTPQARPSGLAREKKIHLRVVIAV